MTNETKIQTKPDELSPAIEQNPQVADLFGHAVACYEANNNEAFIADFKSALEIDASATINLTIDYLVNKHGAGSKSKDALTLAMMLSDVRVEKDLSVILNVILNHLTYELCVTVANAFICVKEKHKESSCARYICDSTLKTMALQSLSRAIELEPQKAMTYKLRADIKREMDNIDSALSDYQKSLELDPDNASVQALIADVYMQVGHYLKAVLHYSKALMLSKDNSEYLSKRARAYISAKMYTEALYDYSHALSIAPKNPAVLFDRALLFGNMGEYEKGLDDIICVRNFYHDRAYNRPAAETDFDLEAIAENAPLLKRADSIKAFLNYKILLRDNKIDDIGNLDFEAISPKMIYFIALDYYSHINDDVSLENILTSAKDAFYQSHDAWQNTYLSPDQVGDIARLYGVADMGEALIALTSVFTLTQWVVFVEKWFLEFDIVSQPREYNLREYARAFDEFIKNISHFKISNTPSDVILNSFSNNLLHLHKKYCDFNLLYEILHIPVEAVILKSKLSILKYVMDDYEGNMLNGLLPMDEPVDSSQIDNEVMEDFARIGQIIRMLPFYHILNKALQEKYTELLLKSEREKAEREINARVEERNRVIQDMSHSIKNVMASVVEPLNELAEKYTDQRVTIQKALRGATIIRETVNALNWSYRGCIDDFVRDAESARCAPEGKAELKHLLDMALECAVNNMFDGKYFADFTHSYFPTREIFHAAESAWQLSRSDESNSLIDFLGKFMFEYNAEYPENISTFRLDDRHNSPLKLTILFQELLLNAVKYACFADRKERFVAIKVEADNANVKIKISNSFVPGKSARTTRIGNEIVNNFVKLLAGTYSIDKTDRIYSVTLQFPNIFSPTCQESLPQAPDKAVCPLNDLEEHENSICGR